MQYPGCLCIDSFLLTCHSSGVHVYQGITQSRLLCRSASVEVHSYRVGYSSCDSNNRPAPCS